MSYLFAKFRVCRHCSAALMSLFGVKWSNTSAMRVLSNTASAPHFSNSLIATGAVISFANTTSSFASISSPATTWSKPACAARIFWVMVIPIGFSSLKCLFSIFIVTRFSDSKCKPHYNSFVFIHCILFTSRQGYGCPTKQVSKSLSHSPFTWNISVFHPYRQNATCWKKAFHLIYIF